MTNGVNSSNSLAIDNNTLVYDWFCASMPEGILSWVIFAFPSAFVGLPASMWLLWVLIQRHRGGLTNNVYTMNLTIMDLAFNLGIISHVLNVSLWQNLDLYFMCAYVFPLSTCGRPLLMAFVCADSYVAVVHPITYMRIKNMRYRMVLSLMVWALLLISCVPDGTVYVVCICVALSVPVIGFCNVSVLWALNKPDPSGRTDVHPQKQRALQIVVNSLLISILSYPTLLVGYSVYFLSMKDQYVFCYVYLPSFIPCTLGSMMMPLVYLGNLGSLKKLPFLHCKKYK